MGRPDLELLSKARAGDKAAMDEFLRTYERRLYRFGLRMCGDEQAARDVLQETLVSAFRNLPGFRGEADISTWLYQIARSFCVKSRRRHAGEPAEAEPLDSPRARSVPEPSAMPEDRAQAREVGEILQAAILALPEPHREVIVLKDVEGLSAEEVAGVTGEQVAAVKSRLHRARLQLRSNLSTLFGSDGPHPATGAACPGLLEELAGYASGDDIDQAACVRLEEHLSSCRRCSAACEALKRSVSLCRQIPGGEVPPPVQAAVRQALRAFAP